MYKRLKTNPNYKKLRAKAQIVGVYDDHGEAGFWPVHDVRLRPPRSGRPKPSSLMTLDQALGDCARLFGERNSPPFAFSNE